MAWRARSIRFAHSLLTLGLRGRLRFLLSLGLLPLSACGSMFPAPPPREDFTHGTIALYPGADNSYGEMSSVYQGLRMAGAEQGIEVVPWAGAWENLLNPPQRLEHIRAWAPGEAQRLADF